MDELRLPAVAARVVAWHNRNPLARRISAAQVRSVGYVGLSLAGEAAVTPAASADERAAPPGRSPLPDGTAADETAAAHSAAPAALPADEDEAAALAALAALAEPAAQAASPAAALVPEPGPGAAAPAIGFEVELDLRPAAEPSAEPGVEPAAEPVDEPVTAPRTEPKADEPAPAAETDGAVEAAAPAGTVADAPLAPAAEPPVLDEEWRPDGAAPEAVHADGDQATVAAASATIAASAASTAIAPPASAAAVRAPGARLRDRLAGRAPSPARVQGGLLTEHAVGRPVHAAAAFEHRQGDHFMAPLSPRAVARWVARHGLSLLAPPQDGPVRAVSTARVAGGPQGGTHYVLTAAIDVGGLRSRVLVGSGAHPAVLGARLLSGPRVAVAGALGLAVLLAAAGAALALRRPVERAAAPVEAHAAPAPAASAASAAASAPSAPESTAHEAEPGADTQADAPAGAPAETQADTKPGAHAEAPSEAQPDAQADAATAPPANPHAAAAPAPALVVTTVKPPTAYAQKGRIALPGRGLGLSEAEKAAAREAVDVARAQVGKASRAGPAAPAPPPGADARAPVQETAAAATPAGKPGPVYALSTRTLRTRAEAEQVQAAMAALLRAGGSPVRLELLPEGEDWRVVAWPFADPAGAERARALLAGRGMKVSVVGL